MDEQNKLQNLSTEFKIFLTLKSFMTFGGGFFYVLLPWMIISLTGSPFLTGAAEGIVAIPLLTSFIIGSLIDKLKNKVNAFAFSVLGIAFFSSFLLFSLYTGVTYLVIIAIFVPTLIISYLEDIQATISSFFDKILLSRENLKKGVSLRRGTRSLTNIMGIVIFALFISFGLRVSIYFLMVIYLLSFFIFLTIRKSLSTKKSQNDSTQTARPFYGLTRFLSFPLMKELTFIAIVGNFFFGMIIVGFTVMIKIYFGLGGAYLSYILGIFAIGDGVGSLLTAKIRSARGSIVALSMIILGILFMAIYLISSSHLYYILFPVVFLIGLIPGITNVLIYGFMLKNTDEKIIGSTFGSFSSLFGGVTFLSSMISGGILVYFTAPNLFLLMGVSILIVGIISRIIFRRLNAVSL